MRISKCAWCGKARKQVSRDYGNPTGIAVMLHSERFSSLRMHSGCVYAFTTSLSRVLGFDSYSIPFVSKEFAGFKADEVRNA